MKYPQNGEGAEIEKYFTKKAMNIYRKRL